MAELLKLNQLRKVYEPPTYTLSACYIARDAEKTIERSIASIGSVADEIVLALDDRTRDRTVEVARAAVEAMGIPLFVREFHWIHDFSYARNLSIEDAHGEYCLIMDADEYLAEGDDAKIEQALADSEMDLFTCPAFLNGSYGDPNYEEPTFGRCGINWRNRIFRKASGARYRQRVHEVLVFPSDDGFSEKILIARFYHEGSMTQEKSDYYAALLILDHLDNRAAPVPALMLAERALIRQDAATAFKFIHQVDPDRIGSPGIAAKYWTVKGKITQCVWVRSLQQKQKKTEIAEEALGYYQKAAEICPVDPQGATHAAIILFAAFPERMEEGAETLRKLLEDDPSNVAAREMLEIYERFGSDRIDFLNRLGHYIIHMGQVEREAALEANGYTPDENIARLEQLDEILGERRSFEAGAEEAEFKMGDRDG